MMTSKTHTPIPFEPGVAQSNDGKVRPELNPDDYREDMAEFELTREQEDELLEALWNIMSAFVDMGWGLDSAQTVLAGLFEKAGQDSGKLLQKKVNETVSKSAVGKDKNTDE